ncbi:MAG: winged helix-turn-helix domain-containing protein [Acidobacteriia bacterium]|nr:winged helix-turn-helix domain-containing protein [Terriglobia bacterium]
MPVVVNHLYEFGKFRVDADRGVLLEEDKAVSLTAKTFEILLVLIQHPNQTVSKDALLKAVWPNTFVEEANLTQHVSMLRKALGDSPQDRRYIATVPGQGYRFVAEVRELSRGEAGIDATAQETIVIEQHSREEITLQESRATGLHAQLSSWTSRIGVRTWIAMSVTIAAILIITVRTGSGHLSASGALSVKDSILLADFENSTGESVFDGTLKEGMAVELGQSPFLELASTQRVRETLRLMGRPAEAKVLMPLAREVCQRLGTKVLIAGSITRLGTTYVVSIEADNCADATTLAREQVEARNKEEVLPLLGKAASRMRARLGESLATIQKFDVPLEQATTTSLEALKAYSLGMEQRARAAEKEALPLFQHAIELDPNFALAYAQMGTIYRNLGESERSNECFKKAFDLRANLSERERLYLTARYYQALGETDKLIETYEVATAMYPRDPQPFSNLSAVYQVVGQYERAAAAAQSALALDPNRYVPYANLAMAYLALNRIDDAKQISQQASAGKHDSLYTHQVLFEIAMLHHDQAAMQQEMDWAHGTDRENDMLTTQAASLAAAGRLASAEQLFSRSWTSSQESGLSDSPAYSMAGAGLAEADFGDYKTAREHAAAALKIGHGIDAEETAAEALALSGDVRRAQELVDSLHQRFPRHSVLNHAALASTQAAIELQRNNPLKAIVLLEQAAPYDLCEFAGLSPVYLRGEAYRRAHRGREAAEQFQKILDHPGINASSQRHALAYLGLARSLMLTGDVVGARKAYADFFSAWSNADPDTPILQQAKREYGKIQ